jgi:hypothetical protein
LAYRIDKELYQAIDCLPEQVRGLVEQQEKQNKRILLTSNQRMTTDQQMITTLFLNLFAGLANL